MKKLYIIKIGGNILDDEQVLDAFVQQVSSIEHSFILVHGGGKIATSLSQQLGIEPRMIEGRRITDEETLKVVVMVYAGLTNKQLVAKLQSKGCNAIGLCGADANIIPAQKRPVFSVDYGYVGNINAHEINTESLQSFLKNGLTPVIAPITHDQNGQLLNTNADTVASSLAIAFAPFYETHLVFGFEKKGVFKQPDDETTIIPIIHASEYAELKMAGIISNGMIPKLDNAFHAIEQGTTDVVIGHALQLIDLIQQNNHAGTRLVL